MCVKKNEYLKFLYLAQESTALDLNTLVWLDVQREMISNIFDILTEIRSGANPIKILTVIFLSFNLMKGQFYLKISLPLSHSLPFSADKLTFCLNQNLRLVSNKF